jgi:hypothetical protein
VAIRADDADAFHQAGIPDLAAKYLHKKIRAQGIVVRDEGQWLLVVKSPRDIALQDDAPGSPPVQELIIVDEQGKETKLPVPLPQEISRTQWTVEHDGVNETYEGVSVTSLLKQCGMPVGSDSRGRLLGRYVVISAADGYAVAFSLGELDAYFAKQEAMLAERLNGGSLPETRAPLRLVVPGDQHRRRWVGRVTRIEVRNALDKPAAGAP